MKQSCTISNHTNKAQSYTILRTRKTYKTQKASHQSTDEAKLHQTAFLIDTSYVGDK